MSQIFNPPEGYSCVIVGFNNIPQARYSDKMPTPKAIQTPLVDSRADHSNTTRLPVSGPNVPKGM